MSFNPQTGLVYIPAQNIPVSVIDDKNWTQNAQHAGQARIGASAGTSASLDADAAEEQAVRPPDRLGPGQAEGSLAAEYVAPWNGGTLTTAGNLVFQGTADGRFIAYNATTGEKLWETPVGTGVVAAPSTYKIDGKQYVSIAVGWGGVYGIAARHRAARPGHGLHLRGGRQRAAA